MQAWQAAYACTMVWRPTGEDRIEPTIYARVGKPRDFKTTKGFQSAFEADADRPDGRPSHFYETLRRVCEGEIAEIGPKPYTHQTTDQ